MGSSFSKSENRGGSHFPPFLYCKMGGLRGVHFGFDLDYDEAKICDPLPTSPIFKERK